ncbi:MOSC domain-containing protein [Prosthecomicrobium pneumaticum]|uniref:MOSC domain-containing protein n=1 Tax=Prosthecomicrobium pneumaticum TaxID=81895 RepID=A0A7W9FLQ5_9HYPH|nr:molybdenum cofactor sulfurase [Prosthecomicrobium pneumaticum]MBB5752971.1 hypothetical protein [Prosthecomicrobium pneumaticum]
MSATDLFPAEILPARRFPARVDEVLVGDGTGFETRGVEAITLTYGGVAGDLHAGLTRPSGAREPWYRRGTEMKNDRQVSIVDAGELAEAAALMEIDAIRPEWIGANLVLSGIPDLTWLPPRTRLLFEGGATIVIDGHNGPCRQAGAAIARHYPGREGLDLAFPKAARHRRGLVGWVEREGRVAAGETLTVLLWERRIYR